MNVLVVYYSRYGHTLKLATAARDGVDSVGGVKAVFRRVAEFPEEEADILQSEHAKAVWDQQKATPVVTPDDLRDADGLIVGTPTRFGNMAAQMKRLFDSAAALWMEGAMEGKPAAVLTSTASTHGGQETTLLSMMIPLLHLGMIVVGVPYSVPGMIHTEGRGGTPYGATTVAGPKNDRVPTDEELEIARALGQRVARIATQVRP